MAEKTWTKYPSVFVCLFFFLLLEQCLILYKRSATDIDTKYNIALRNVILSKQAPKANPIFVVRTMRVNHRAGQRAWRECVSSLLVGCFAYSQVKQLHNTVNRQDITRVIRYRANHIYAANKLFLHFQLSENLCADNAVLAVVIIFLISYVI